MTDRLESALDRMRRADKTLTDELRWVVYDSDERSEHAAPASFAKRESERAWALRKNLLFWIAFGFALLISIWAVVR